MRKRKRNSKFIQRKKIKINISDDGLYDNGNDNGNVELYVNSEVDDSCVICLDLKKNNAVVPCGHVCFCDVCSKIKIFFCPMCNVQIQSILKLYF